MYIHLIFFQIWINVSLCLFSTEELVTGLKHNNISYEIILHS